MENKIEYYDWIVGGCESKKYGNYKSELQGFFKSLKIILKFPISYAWEQVKGYADEMWQKTKAFFISFSVGSDLEYCKLRYLCAQEGYKSFRLALKGIEWCKLLSAIRDFIWYIKPVSHVSYRLSQVNLQGRFYDWMKKLDFSTEVIENCHTMEEVESYTVKLYEDLADMKTEFYEALVGTGVWIRT